MYRSDSNILITSWWYFNNGVNFACCYDFLPPFDWLVQQKISGRGGGEMIMFNSENRFKNPKNRQFFSDFNEKSACVHAA